MGIIVNIKEWQDKKKKQKDNNSVAANALRDSLDNDQVMRRYNINTPTYEERQANIRASIDRVNRLMEELSQNTKDGGKAK